MEKNYLTEAKTFEAGAKPTPEDFPFKTVKETDPETGEEKEVKGEQITELDGTDAKGKKVKFVLLTNGHIAEIRKGKGRDAEKATIEANGNQAKYMSSMMASTTLIEGKPVSMFDLSDMDLTDYQRIQVAFAGLNF